MLYVGFGGKAQTGKGTAARMLRKVLRNESILAAPAAYAWPMKMRTAVLESFSIDETLSKPPHVRTAFQLAGTEEGRDKYGDDFWVKHLLYYTALYADEEPECKVMTVVDARFPNELAFIKDSGGLLVWIDSDRQTLVGEQAQHASETSVTPTEFDRRIINNRDTSLDDLFGQIVGLAYSEVIPRIYGGT